MKIEKTMYIRCVGVFPPRVSLADKADAERLGFEVSQEQARMLAAHVYEGVRVSAETLPAASSASKPTKAERERDALIAAIKDAYDVGHSRMISLTMADDPAARNWTFFLAGVAHVYEQAFGDWPAEEDPSWTLPVKVTP